MKVRIASIYFEGRKLNRSQYGGMYEVPSVKKGENPFILEVPDKGQMDKLPHIIGGGHIRRVITGEEIAHDIVQHWAQNGMGMKPEVGPGIWQIREFLPVVNEHGIPQKDSDGRVMINEVSEEQKKEWFAEDLAFNIARQDRWIEHLIGEGDRMALNPKEIPYITSSMKAAVKYSGRQREWTLELKSGDRSVCSFCGMSIVSNVIICTHCHEVLDAKRYQANKDRIAAAAGSGGVKAVA